MLVPLPGSRAFRPGPALGLGLCFLLVALVILINPRPQHDGGGEAAAAAAAAAGGSRESAATATQLVARLARGHARDNYGFIDATGEAEYCGLVVVCSWPMPPAVSTAYTTFADKLREALPPAAYIYPMSTLHVTVLTIRTFAAGAMESLDKAALQLVWTEILDSAKADPRWPRQPFRLRLRRPTFDGTTGIIRYDDVDGAVAAARAALEAALSSAGAIASVGSGTAV